MREIKFRAWEKDEGKIRDWEYLSNEIGYGYNKVNGTDIDDCIFNDDMLILMQYTGLKDKNGKEIYEGDIINNYEYFFEKGIVEYRGNSFVVVYKNEFLSADNWWQKCEVIGNIYEKHELITA